MLWTLCLAGRLLMYEEGRMRMLEWIKRHKVFVIICFAIIVIGVPFAIHCFAHGNVNWLIKRQLLDLLFNSLSPWQIHRILGKQVHPERDPSILQPVL